MRHTYFTSLFLCTSSLLVVACSQPEKNKTQNTAPTSIEVIQEDLIPVQVSPVENKVSFTGTIRAVEQSSIQAQITATATAVNVQVGQTVKKNEILVRLNNQDNLARLAQAKANLASAQAQAQLAQNLMQRKKRLLDQGFISRVEYEQSQVDYKAQQETANAQKANVNIAQKAEQDGIIRSPISGVITTRQVEPGQTVTAGQTLFEIINPSQLEIQASLPIDEQNFLKIGQTIDYQIQGTSEQRTAVISRISPVANQANRQIEFFAKPLQDIKALSIGAFIQGTITQTKQQNGQTLPLNVVQNIEQQPYVWVIRNNKIHRVNVEVIETNFSNNQIIVLGLNANDQVSRIGFKPEDENKTIHISNSPSQ